MKTNKMLEDLKLLKFEVHFKKTRPVDKISAISYIYKQHWYQPNNLGYQLNSIFFRSHSDHEYNTFYGDNYYLSICNLLRVSLMKTYILL